MAKMTKAAARKRLEEAAQKILKVWLANPGDVLSTQDLNAMAKFAQNDLSRMERKLRR
jgi:hypothetical protein